MPPQSSFGSFERSFRGPLDFRLKCGRYTIQYSNRMPCTPAQVVESFTPAVWLCEIMRPRNKGWSHGASPVMCSDCLSPLTYLIDMRPPNAGLIGKRGSLSELMTPALVLDLDAFEQNVSAFQQLINAHELKARPHAKSHKCAEIARRQIDAGSVGISTATLHEAEALAEKGITDILITSPIVGLAKRERLLQLLEGGIVLTIVVDNPEQVPSPSNQPCAHRY